MRTILIVLICTVACAQVATAQTTKPATAPTTAPSDDAYLPPPTAPLPPGMTPIFDGKTLDGWSQIPANSWTVKNGACKRTSLIHI